MPTPQIDALAEKAFVLLEAKLKSLFAENAPAAPTFSAVAQLPAETAKLVVDSEVASGSDDAVALPAYEAVASELEPLHEGFDPDDEKEFMFCRTDADIQRRRIELALEPLIENKLKDLYVEATADKQADYVVDVARRINSLMISIKDKVGTGENMVRHNQHIRVLAKSIEGDTPAMTAMRASGSAQWLTILPKLVGHEVLDVPFGETGLAREASYAMMWEHSEKALGRDRTQDRAPSAPSI